MKNIFLILFLFFVIKINAQTKGYNFQGVARDASGVIISNQKISLRFSIIASTPTGKNEYSEIRHTTTDEQGVFSTVIGDGNAISTTGTVDSINWKLAPKFLKVEMDPTAGNLFFDMGTTQLRSVPYANYANYANSLNAENIIGAIPISKGGTGLTAAGSDGQVLSSSSNGTLAWITPANNIKHAIGEVFGGGVVFYVTPDGLHGLIAETRDQGLCSWYDALEVVSKPANHSTAGKNYVDWRLPTKYELNLLYSKKSIVGGVYYSNGHWCSTEVNNTYAISQEFGVRGEQFTVAKGNTNTVRSIRSF